MWLLLLAFAALVAACIDHAEIANSLAYFEANGTQSLSKRYYHVSSPPSRFWPNGVVLYCMDSTVTDQNVMRAWIAEAWKRWVDTGADTTFVDVREGDNADCSAANRANVLMVSQNSNGALRTSYGRSPAIPVSPNNPGSPGPAMSLDLSPNVGMRDVAGNVAHEIGHAFGMMHEHQRPDLWTSPYPDGEGPKNAFILDCRNLADYQDMVQNTPNAADQTAKCRSFAAAAQVMANGNTFSASEFVPLPDNILVQFTSPGGGRKIDLNSIMIYGSQAGGAPRNNGRATVYTLSNGNQINYNAYPSRRDVNALNAMYGSAKKYSKVVYWARDSPFYGLFTQHQLDSGLCELN